MRRRPPATCTARWRLSQHFESVAAADLAAGRRVPDDHMAPFPGFFIYYLAREKLPPKLRVFVDFLREGA